MAQINFSRRERILKHMNQCDYGLIGALDPESRGVEHTTTKRQRKQIQLRGVGETEDNEGTKQTVQTALIGLSDSRS